MSFARGLSWSRACWSFLPIESDRDLSLLGFHLSRILPPSESATLIILNLVTLVATICLGYYAAKIFFFMRLGRLERGWKLVTGGAVCLSFAFLSLTFQHLFSRPADISFYFDAFGMSLSIAGIILMVLGLRSHLAVWTRRVDDRVQRPILSVLRERKRDSES